MVADLPAPDDFYRIWGLLTVTDGVPGHVEPDARTVPWHTLRRLALLGGEFTAPYRPVSAREITDTLVRARENGGPGLLRAAQRRQLAWLFYRYGLGGAAIRWDSCPCRTPRVHLAAGGRAGLFELGPGGLVAGEGGLGGRGLQLMIEPELELWSGSFWLGATGRVNGPLLTGGRGLDDAFRYDGWPPPTNRNAEGRARGDEAWHVTAPRAAVGVASGSWSITAGLFPAQVGPGLDGGGLTLTTHGDPVPQVVVRRTRPFVWPGVLGWVDPHHLLLRTGVVSRQTVTYQEDDGTGYNDTHPMFSQWLVTWNHTSWWRTTVTHAVLAAPRAGEELWGDLLQINFPRLETTLDEIDDGPVTDRIFTVAMEARFREGPWPLLPSAAGRVWWEYGAEDVRPHDDFRILPEMAAPGSLAGIELVDHRWDLAVEYLHTQHPTVLWYGNVGYPAGFSHRGTVLGHDLGGGARAWTALVRVRPDSGVHEWELRGRTANWDDNDGLPGRAERREIDLVWRRLTGSGAWSLSAGWLGEEVDGESADWWRAHVQRRF